MRLYASLMVLYAFGSTKSGANRGQIGLAKSLAEADPTKNVAPIQLTRRRIS